MENVKGDIPISNLFSQEIRDVPTLNLEKQNTNVCVPTHSLIDHSCVSRGNIFIWNMKIYLQYLMSMSFYFPQKSLNFKIKIYSTKKSERNVFHFKF